MFCEHHLGGGGLLVGPRQYLIPQTSELTTKSRIASRFSPSAVAMLPSSSATGTWLGSG